MKELKVRWETGYLHGLRVIPSYKIQINYKKK